MSEQFYSNPGNTDNYGMTKEQFDAWYDKWEQEHHQPEQSGQMLRDFKFPITKDIQKLRKIVTDYWKTLDEK